MNPHREHWLRVKSARGKERKDKLADGLCVYPVVLLLLVVCVAVMPRGDAPGSPKYKHRTKKHVLPHTSGSVCNGLFGGLSPWSWL